MRRVDFREAPTVVWCFSVLGPATCAQVRGWPEPTAFGLWGGRKPRSSSHAGRCGALEGRGTGWQP